MSCEFYGYHAIPAMRVLARSGGNQCALVTSAFAPCKMELAGRAPDWPLCPYNPSAPIPRSCRREVERAEFNEGVHGGSHAVWVDQLRSYTKHDMGHEAQRLMPKAEANRTITITVSATVYSLLEVLAGAAGTGPTVEDVVSELIDHAQQGVYRPGSWERPWLCQAFGGDWTSKLEVGDPYGRPDAPMFRRPKKQEGS
jgi:hypothetical protein